MSCIWETTSFSPSVASAGRRLAPLWPFAGFLAVVWLSTFTFPLGLERAITYSQVLILLVCTYLTISRSQRTWPLEIGFLVGILVIWHLGGSEFSEVRERESQRFAFALGGDEDGLNPNSYGLYLALTILFALKFLLVDSPRLRKSWLWWSRASLMIIGIIIAAQQIIVVTGSRKAQLMLLFLCGASFLIYTKGRFNISRIVVGASAAAFLAYAAFTLLAGTAHFSRLENLVEMIRYGDTSDGSAMDRSYLVERGIELWKASPLIGHGNDSFTYISGFGTYSHSNPVELMANLGILGLVLYYGVHYKGIFRAVRLMKLRRSYARCIGIWFVVAMICFIGLFDLFAVSYYDKAIAIFLGAALAVIYSTRINHFRPDVKKSVSYNARQDELAR
jgi:hypothetical protein